MSITPRPPIPSFLPETAPFTPEQRAWLNGLFAGAVRPARRRDAAVGAEVAQARARSCIAGAGRRKPTTARPGTTRRMPLAERMKLAEGKPLPRRMMAAMAQQDCGQCGYNCQDYADALFTRKKSG